MNAQDLLGGYTEQEVAAAFKRVENPEHWKGAIDRLICVATTGELNLVLFAIGFYTATEAKAELVRRERGLDTYRITAPGYWAGPAN